MIQRFWQMPVSAFVLEDEDSDFAEMVRLLQRIVPDTTKQLHILRSTYEPLRPREPEVFFFTAPMHVAGAVLISYQRRSDEPDWDIITTEESYTKAVVPWQIDPPGENADYFAPHVVMLDAYIRGGDGASDPSATLSSLQTTLASLEGCSYPTELTWILSRGSVENEYGVVVPKPWIVASSDSRNGIEAQLRDILQRHLGGLAGRNTGGKRRANSYPTEKAEDFYKLVQRKPWRLYLTLDEERKSSFEGFLVENWGVAESRPPHVVLSYLDTRVSQTEKPSPPPHFTFYDGALSPQQQEGYVIGHWCGLPARYIRDGAGWLSVSGTLYKAAVDLNDPRVPFTIRRNLYVLLRLLLGKVTAFNDLAAALPGIVHTAATLYGNELFREKPGKWFSNLKYPAV